jgi:ABC-type uncharacterized transport system ATPase subunit
MTDEEERDLVGRVRVLEMVADVFFADLKKRLTEDDREQIGALLQGLALGVSSPGATALLSKLSSRLD